MNARRIGCIAVLLAAAALGPRAALPQASAPAALGNDGTPMLLPFACTDEDIRWAGLSCSEESPCPMFLEISTVETLGNRVLLAGNIHAEAVTLYSVLLASDDNGHNWREAHERIRGAGLDRIETLGAGMAWISGQVLFPFTQEPFLLATDDGGKTWNRREVLRDDDESRYGSIQQYFFSSKDNGTLILDRGAGAGGEERYALYESADGGNTWAVKQQSRKPMAVKRPPAAPSDWRVRPDGGMKSFLVEHRSATRWSAVAAFLVKLDPCKPTESGGPPGELAMGQNR